jgi:hypothetical protein
MAAKKKAPRRRKITVEVQAHPNRKPQPGEIDAPGVKTRTDIVAEMFRQRNRPKHITYEELVPKHVREMYAHIWHNEHEALLREEALKEAYTWRGIRRRIWRSVADTFAGSPEAYRPERYR